MFIVVNVFEINLPIFVVQALEVVFQEVVFG